MSQRNVCLVLLDKIPHACAKSLVIVHMMWVPEP